MSLHISPSCSPGSVAQRYPHQAAVVSGFDEADAQSNSGNVDVVPDRDDIVNTVLPPDNDVCDAVCLAVVLERATQCYHQIMMSVTLCVWQ